MIDVSKLSQKDRWRLGFAIAAAGNLDGEDNSTNEFFYSGVFGKQFNSDDEEDFEPVAPSYEEMKQQFKEFFGFDYDEIWNLDTLNPFGD